MKFTLVRCVDILLVSLWAGICASVPEVIWQGGKLLVAHGEPVQFLITSVLVGLMLAFFVEPLIERLKARSWIVHHGGTSRTFVTILVSVLFGMVTVCIHQCIETLLHSHSVTDSHAHETSGLQAAIRIAVQWSFIPTIVTATWFIGLRNRRLGNWLSPIACLVALVVTAGPFGWHIYNALASSVVALITSTVVLNPPGGREMIARIRSDPLVLSLTAGLCFAVCTIVLATVNNYVVKIDYDGLDYIEDARFYIGWTLGLSFLPAPYRARFAPAVPGHP